ncbi:MAG: polyphosphate kinase 2 family protein [Lysinibacillus sp.]
MQKLEDLNLSLELDKKLYKKKLKVLQYEMLNVQQFLFNNKIGLILAFEGMDAAGKGGAIKRLTEHIDPRGYVVHPISAPQPHELRYNYMHRFWRKLPQHGQIAIFDRSWYGRVLVERLEGFATKDEWKRAYDEINDFERLLTAGNYIIIKFWIHIDKDEQLNRFNARAQDPYKSWKLTDEDWRNREKFDDYVAAADEMFEKTNSENAPWILVAGNDKQYARIQVLKETLAHIEKEAKRRGLEIPNLFEREERKAIAELEQAVKEVAAGLVEEVEEIKEVKGITSVRKTKSKKKRK